MQKRRVIMTTVWGAIFGIVCMLLQKYGARVSLWPIGISILIYRSVMGFTIGVSSLRIHWAPHGILWGFLFGIFFVIALLGTPVGFWGPLGVLMLWGFVIELITTVGFKLKMTK